MALYSNAICWFEYNIDLHRTIAFELYYKFPDGLGPQNRKQSGHAPGPIFQPLYLPSVHFRQNVSQRSKPMSKEPIVMTLYKKRGVESCHMTLLSTLTRTGFIPEYGNNTTKEPVSYLAIIEI